MSFTITRFVKFDGDGALKAFCDVSVKDILLIKGVRVIIGRNGPFVSMPRQQGRNGKWYDSVVPLTKETRLKLIQAVLEAFEASHDSTTLEGSNDGTARSHGFEDLKLAHHISEALRSNIKLRTESSTRNVW